MLIRVMYKDGKFDMVKPQLFDNLLEEWEVTSFIQSGGWVGIGREFIRGSHGSKEYLEPECRVHYCDSPL